MVSFMTSDSILVIVRTRSHQHGAAQGVVWERPKLPKSIFRGNRCFATAKST